MERIAAALMRRPDDVAAAFAFLTRHWPRWVSETDLKSLSREMYGNWLRLVSMLRHDEGLAAEVLAVSAVASVLEQDGALLIDDRAEAESRLQMACRIDGIPNFPSYFMSVAKFFELKPPE